MLWRIVSVEKEQHKDSSVYCKSNYIALIHPSIHYLTLFKPTGVSVDGHLQLP